MLHLRPVHTESDKRKFYNFAKKIYRDDPNWVPHLWPQRKAYLDGKGAFYEYGEAEFWIAEEDGSLLGTIGLGIDHAWNEARGEKTVTFGFFEVVPDRYDVAKALWDKGLDWARARGIATLRGPHSFSNNDEPGFLVEGFDTQPAILMSHSQPYYIDYVTRYGFVPMNEGLAYRLDTETLGPNLEYIPPVVRRIAERATERHGKDVIRKASMENWDEEITRIHPMYNRSLTTLNGSTPIQLGEFREQAEGLKSIMDPDLAFIAELEGQVVGFTLGLANINEALAHANGLRWPWNYLQFAAARRHITGVSYKIVVMDPDVWGMGIDTIMHLKMFQTMVDKGYTWIDGSITSADNPQTNKIAAKFGAKVYRRYRAYRFDF